MVLGVMFGRGIYILSCLLICPLSTVFGLPWLLGCLHGNVSSDLRAPSSQSAVSKAVCLETCSSKERPDFVIFHNDGVCLPTDGKSLGQLLGDLEVDCEKWDFLRDGEPLRGGCHGDRTRADTATSPDVGPLTAVFLCRGPEIENITLRSPPVVYVGDVVTLQATASLSLWYPPRGVNASYLRLRTDWYHGDSCVYTEHVPVSLTESEGSGEAISVWLHQFSEPGLFLIGVTVNTGAARVGLTTQLTIHPPIPSGLQLTLHPGATVATPTCIPAHLSDSPEPALLVFTRQRAPLQASLSTGAGVTFYWQFSDGSVSARRLPPAGTSPLRCLGLDCRRAVVEHVFETEGVHTVNVSVTSPYGNLEGTFHVVAVDYRLEDLTLTHKSNTLGLTSPLTAVHFLVSLTITSRQPATLLFQAGDGSLLRHIMKEAAPSDTNPDFMVASNYGNGCRLTVELRHVYTQEGEFRPSANVSDGKQAVTAALPHPLKVYNTLEGATLRGDTAVGTKSFANFTLTLMRDSNFRRHVTWRVFRGDGSLLAERNSSNTSWQFSFPQVGWYTIQASVSNPVASTSAVHTVVAQDPILGLTIRSPLPTPAVKVRQQATFRADYGEGSNVTCSWTFSCRCRSCLQTRDPSRCVVAYTFLSAGPCRVAVVARNAVNELTANLARPIVVQHEVAGVYATISSPVLLGSVTTVSAAVLQGSDVKMAVTFPQALPISARYSDTTDTYVAQKVAAQPGDAAVLVRAYNQVSSVTVAVNVQVRPPLGAIKVKSLGCRVMGQPVLLVVTVNGHVPSENEQLLYTWRFGNSSEPTYSSVPILQLLPTNPSGISVFVIVSNGVDIRTTRNRIELETSSSLSCLRHPASVLAGRGATITLQIDKEARNSSVRYRITKKTHADSTPWSSISLSANSDHYSWSHLFAFPGLAHIEVVISQSSSDLKSVSLHSVISVQQQLQSLHIEGPRAVRVNGLPVQDSWEAILIPPPTSGTLYEWAIGEHKAITVSNKFSHSFSLPGPSLISVKAWNAFSELKASHRVDALMIITAVETTVLNALKGKPASFFITTQGGQEIDVLISFGDGNHQRIDKKSFKSMVEMSSHYILNFEVIHKYSSVGHFHVWVNASNDVSWLTHSTTVAVGEPISGIALTLLSPPLVALLEEVTVQVSVESGTDLSFVWDFGDKSGGLYTSVNSTEKLSIAYHSYGIANTYKVAVNISSPHYKEPIVANLDTPIQAVELIEQLHLRPVENRYASALDQHLPWNQTTMSWFTKPITFQAEVWRGSDVHFLFHFGDGHHEDVPAIVTMWSMPTGRATHVYSSEGVFHVSVTARNPLGSVLQALNQSFIVQIPPQNLSLNQEYYIAPQGSIINLHASVSRGTNVSFDWIVGEDTHLLDAGPTVTLSFMKSGTYFVTVIAYNNVTDLAYEKQLRCNTSAKIFIQEPLQGVELCIVTVDQGNICEGSELELPAGEQVAFEAKVLPETEVALRFTWELGIGELRKTNSPKLNHKYRDPGNYVINVTAQNHISSTSSGAIKVHLVQKVGNLTSIHHPGSILVGQQVSFHALYWFGTSLTFKWHFGDGESAVQTDSPLVQHTYSKMGEFWVEVHAWNKFSEANTSTNIFVLDQPCQKPKITFVDQSRRRSYSEDIQLEADFIISCNITSEVTYDWSLKKNSTTLQMNISESTWHQKTLLIPSSHLPIGEYLVQLKVQMTGTIVYSIETTTLFIEAPPLILNIKGGIFRKVGWHKDITLTPFISNNENENTSLSFSWACSGLNQKLLPCFTNVWPNLSSQNLKIPSGSLNSKLNAFLFNLTFNKGERSATASQVLDVIDNSNLLLLRLNCVNCHQHQIAVDRKLIFEVVCDNCGILEVEYTWHLWLIQDGNHNLQISEYDCVQADGSTFFIITSNLTPSAPVNMLPNGWNTQQIHTANKMKMNNIQVSKGKTAVDDFPPFPSLPGFPDDESLKYDSKSEGHSKRRTPRADWLSSDRREHPPEFLLPPVEGEAMYENFSHNNNFLSFQDLIPAGPVPRPPYPFQTHDFPVTEEGLPGEGGSAVARDQSLQHFGDILIGSAEKEDGIMEGRGKGRGGAGSGHSGILPHPGHNSNSHKGDPVKDDRITIKTPLHLVERPKTLISLLTANTTTGLKSRYLVLKPGVLRIGSTYLVEVTAKAIENSSVASGSAMDYISAPLGPMNGRCTLMPTTGQEFETPFRLHCLEWQSENLPLFYELRYSLSPNGPSHLIYFGLNRNVKFILPSGTSAYNFSVYLDVMVHDSHGAGTRVCSIVREVYPKDWGRSVNLENYLLNATFHPKSLLNKLLGEKNIQGVLQLIHVLVSSMKHQERINVFMADNFANSEKQSFEKIRQQFLHIINRLSFFSKSEAVQVLSAASSILQAPNDISDDDLRITLSIVQKVYSNLSDLRGHFPFNQLTGELIKAITLIYESSVIKMTKGNNEESHLADEFDHSRFLLHQVLKEIFKDLVPNEQPFLLRSQHFSAIAFYLTNDLNFPFILNLNGAEILLQRNLFSSVVNTKMPSNGTLNSCSKKSGSALKECCVAILAKSFSQSLLRNTASISNLMIPPEVLPVANQTASVTFLTCANLTELDDKSTSLFQDVEIHLAKPENKTKKKQPYTLLKSEMHVHFLNISQIHLNWSLLVTVELADTEKGKYSFPLQLLLSMQEPPAANNYIIKETFDEKSETLKLFAPPGIIKESGLYFLGIVDAEFNDGYHHNMISSQDYILHMWWQQCLQWNKETWTSDGCMVMNTTELQSIHCRCSHLTEISFLSFDVPTKLLVLPAQHLSHSSYPISFVVILALLLIYIVLLVPACRTDNATTLNPVLMTLKDNNSEYHYKYLVTLETGYLRDSGTTAIVCLVLHGEKGMSDAVQLVGKDQSNTFCQCSSTDSFIVNTKCSLGSLLRVQLWHNNAGSSPSWYLKDITITDLCAGKDYYFGCEQWFSVEGEDGLIERELFVTEPSWKFWKILKERLIYFQHDVHIWVSVYTRPPHSLFTLVQRLTCCFSTTLMSSALTALWYSYYFIEYKSEFGHLDFSFSSICVGSAVAVIVMAPHTLMGVICRYCRAPQLLWTTFLHLPWKWYSWGTAYCWLKQKYSNPRESIDGSSSVPESMYQSYSHSLAYQSGSLEDSEEEKCNSEESMSLASFLRGSLSPLAETLSNWHAFENWARQKHQEPSSSTNDLGEYDSLIEELYGRNDPELVQHIQRERIHSISEIKQNKHLRDERRYGFNCSQETEEESSPHNLSLRDLNEENHSQQSSSGFEDWLDCEMTNRITKSLQSGSTRNHSKGFRALIKPPGMLLPVWMYCFGYLILITLLCCSAYITMKYTSSFGLLRSTRWLQSFLMSLLCSIFILYPLLVFIVAFISTLRSCYYSLPAHGQHTYILNLMNLQCLPSEPADCKEKANVDDSWYGKESNYYFQCTRPPPEPLLIEARRQRLRTKKILSIMRELSSFFIYVLLIVMVYRRATTTCYHQSNAIHNAFLRSHHGPLKITSYKEWWSWLNNDFMPSFYGNVDDNLKCCQLATVVGSISVGYPSVRQFRVSSQLCPEPLLPFSSVTCEPAYSLSTKAENSNSLHNMNMSNIKIASLRRKPLWGKHGFYEGDGLRVQFSENQNETHEMLSYLEKENWLDSHSRAVAVDFLLFNPTFSLFTSVTILIEFPAAGGAVVSSFILPCYLYHYITKWDFIVMACELAFIGMGLWHIKQDLWNMLKLGRSYWKQLWNYTRAIISMLCLFYIICYLYRFSLVESVVEHLHDHHHRMYIDVSIIAEWDEVLGAILGLLIFVHMLNWLRFLHLNCRTYQFLQLFGAARKEIGALQMILFFLIIGYSFIGNLLFGSKNSSSSSPIIQCLNAVRSLLRGFQRADYTEESSSFQIYTFIYTLTVLISFILFFTLLRAILIKVKRSVDLPANNVNLKDVVHFLQEKLLHLCGKQKNKTFNSEEITVSPATEFLLLELENLVENLKGKADKLFSDISPSLYDLSTCDEYNQHEGSCSLSEDPSIDKTDGKPACESLLSHTSCAEPRDIQMAPSVGDIETNSCDESCEPWSSTSNESLPSRRLNSSLTTRKALHSFGKLRSLKKKIRHSSSHQLSNQSSPVSLKSSHLPRSSNSCSSATPSQRQGRVRKTFPILPVGTSSSSELQCLPNDPSTGGLSLRKTKSCGKGKNQDLTLHVALDRLMTDSQEAL